MANLKLSVNTPRELWERVNLEMVTYPDVYIDEYQSSQAYCYLNAFSISSFTEFGLDMKNVGYTKAKWSHLTRGYFNKEQFNNFMERCTHYKNKGKTIPSIGMLFLGDRQKLREDIHEESVNAQGGACLLSVSLLWQKGKKPIFTVHSRSSEITQRFHADLIFINVLLRTIGETLGFAPEDVGVYWVVPRIYQTFYQVIPFLVQIGMEDTVKVWNQSCSRWHKAINKEYIRFHGPKQNYATQQRVVEFYNYLKTGEGKYESILPGELSLEVK